MSAPINIIIQEDGEVHVNGLLVATFEPTSMLREFKDLRARVKPLERFLTEEMGLTLGEYEDDTAPERALRCLQSYRRNFVEWNQRCDQLESQNDRLERLLKEERKLREAAEIKLRRIEEKDGTNKT